MDSLELIYESYTEDIAAPNLVPGIVTECLIVEQQEMNGIADNNDDNRTEIISVDFSCEWSSRYTTVDDLPLDFWEYVTHHLDALTDDMRDAGLPVWEAHPPQSPDISQLVSRTNTSIFDADRFTRPNTCS